MSTRPAGRYAADTKVSIRDSQNEAEAILLRYGVKRYGLIKEPEHDVLAFFIGSTPYRIEVVCAESAGKAAEQSYKQRWRALCLMLKATLEWCSQTDASAATALLPFAVLPSGQTVAQSAPQLVGNGWAAILPKSE